MLSGTRVGTHGGQHQVAAQRVAECFIGDDLASSSLADVMFQVLERYRSTILMTQLMPTLFQDVCPTQR